jgi:hypothetical protein
MKATIGGPGKVERVEVERIVMSCFPNKVFCERRTAVVSKGLKVCSHMTGCLQPT